MHFPRPQLSVRASDEGIETCTKEVTLARCAPLPEQEAVPDIVGQLGRVGAVVTPTPPDARPARCPAAAVARPAAAVQVGEAAVTVHGEAVPASEPILMEAPALVPAVVARLDRS